MSKDVSERFDEHECDTARRGYPKEVVEGTRRTLKMARVDPSSFPIESGTHATISRDSIEQHVREKMLDGLANAQRSGEEDPHTRPTIEAGMAVSTPSGEIVVSPVPPGPWTLPPVTSTPLVTELAPSAGSSSSHLDAFSQAAATATAGRSIPRWLVGVLVFGLLVLVSAAGTAGFFLGRRSAHC